MDGLLSQGEKASAPSRGCTGSESSLVRAFVGLVGVNVWPAAQHSVIWLWRMSPEARLFCPSCSAILDLPPPLLYRHMLVPPSEALVRIK